VLRAKRAFVVTAIKTGNA